MRYLVGVSLLLLSWLIVVSLVVHLLDQSVNSQCGYSCGFSLKTRSWPNPIGWTLSQSAKVFPLDYVVFGSVVFWLFACTVAGLGALDVRFMCMKLFSLRIHETMHNALMMAVGWLVLITVSFQYMLLNLATDYVSFGRAVTHTKCSHSKKSDHHCKSTEIYYILSAIVMGYPIFGLVYFVLSWLFALVFGVSFFVNIFKKADTQRELLVNEDVDDDIEAVFRD